MRKRVMVVRYGYATIEADTDNEAIEIANGLDARSFDWSEPDEAQIVDEDVETDEE